MSTSYAGGPIPFDDAEHVAQQPLSDDVAQCLINNALSFADQAGKEIANWESHAPTTVFMTPRSSMVVGRFYKILEVGPFSLLVRENGAPYNCRVRIAGWVNQANNVTFRMLIAPWGASVVDLLSGTLARPELVLEATTSATSHAWLSPADTLIEPQTIDAADALTEVITLDGIGGDPVGVDECLFTLAIWASTTNVSAIPRLTGYHVCEFHPPPP